MAKKYTSSHPHGSGLQTKTLIPKTPRSILLSLLKTHSQSLNDESSCTLMAEVEGIMNSLSLAVEILRKK